jgi:hypothetical protein
MRNSLRRWPLPGNAYAAAEAANASAISGVLGQLTAPVRSLLDGGGATPAAPAPTPLVQPTLQGTTIAVVDTRDPNTSQPEQLCRTVRHAPWASIPA